LIQEHFEEVVVEIEDDEGELGRAELEKFLDRGTSGQGEILLGNRQKTVQIVSLS
jgi:hypothetical protein